MIPAAALLVGAGVIGWWSPWALSRLAATGTGPGTVIAWWLLAAVGVVAGVITGVLLLVLPGHGPAGAVMRVLHDCWSTVGHRGLPQLDPIAGAGSAAVVAVAAVRLARHSLSRRRHRTVLHRRHLTALRLSGGRDQPPLPTLWLPEDQPIAYSMGGRHPLVVASTGLADRLTEPELRAVLEHERAHIRGHHHLLTGWAEVLGRTLRFIPLMRELPAAMRLLVELAADRTAAARCGAAPLRSALLRVRSGDGPRRALAMAGGDTAIRLDHLDITAEPRFTAGVKAVTGGIAALLAPAAVAVALVVGTSLIVCP
ncbi:M56 family metallopeptidase [Amycolatopsis sp. RTGN1]|uniref:M56 family metallopeptidase n=1 Tax=Amycolatopsis ponsaeliensis TaxID=2992142 RepID=UPI00254AD0F1|nr:M56 family metallopeptidase [Amycolatopsis sp. RTGN1]